MNKYLHDAFVHNTKAAERVIPFLKQLLKIESVIDIGCGTGTWLKICLENGIKNIAGIEGNHLDLSRLVIPKEFVQLCDLEKPFYDGKRFDLAICLEVAEHLQQTVANQFIKQLTSTSDVILFSAAIPFQGGQNHINEQWLNYWIALFAEFGFVPFDIIRPHFWDVAEVEFWYAQNCCLFIKKDTLHIPSENFPTFYNKNLVHPSLFEKSGQYRKSIWEGDVSFSFIIKLSAKKIRRFFSKN